MIFCACFLPLQEEKKNATPLSQQNNPFSPSLRSDESRRRRNNRIRNMASSSSACLRLALRLCSSIRSRQKTRAFAAASVCGETAKKTAAAAAASAAALSTTTPASNPSAAANTASSPKGRAAGSSNDADDNRPLAFVFLGAPGVGKGTYSTRIADALGAEHISTGDLVRAEVKKGSELGKQVRRCCCCCCCCAGSESVRGSKSSAPSRKELVAN